MDMETLDLKEKIIDVTDVDEVMAHRFYADFYLFDLTGEGRIVGSRCPARREMTGKSVYTMLDEEAMELLRGALHRFDVRPLVVGVGDGVGLILSGLIPSSALGVLLIPQLPADILVSALSASEKFDGIWQESVAENRRTVRASRLNRYQTEIDLILEEIDCFSARIAEESLDGETLKGRTEMWSRLAGCPIPLVVWNVERVGEFFDEALFDTLLLLSLLLCRRIASSRTATVMMERRDCGETVSVRIPLRGSGDEARFAPELRYMQILADHKRIPLDYIVSEGFLYLNFTPVRLDWSYLGIKQPDDWSWYTEESEKK